MAWTGSWVPVIIIAQTEPPYFWNNKKGKNRVQPLYPSRIQEDLQNSLGWFKISRRHFFVLFVLFFRSKTIRPGAVRKPETVRRQTPTAEINFTLFSFKTCKIYKFIFYPII